MSSEVLALVNSFPEDTGQFPEYLALEELLLLTFGHGEILWDHIQ